MFAKVDSSARENYIVGVSSLGRITFGAYQVWGVSRLGRIKFGAYTSGRILVEWRCSVDCNQWRMRKAAYRKKVKRFHVLIGLTMCTM